MLIWSEVSWNPPNPYQRNLVCAQPGRLPSTVISFRTMEAFSFKSEELGQNVSETTAFSGNEHRSTRTDGVRLRTLSMEAFGPESELFLA